LHILDKEHTGYGMLATKTVNSRAKNLILFSPTLVARFLTSSKPDYLIIHFNKVIRLRRFGGYRLLRFKKKNQVLIMLKISLACIVSAVAFALHTKPD
jgi:hypothetical protein